MSKKKNTKGKIAWTQTTWNPTTGCKKQSAGCKNCYAENMSFRLKCMGKAKYANGFEPTEHWDELERPKKWKKPRMIFLNSMSDLFHSSFSDDFIKAVFHTMNECPQHTFQVLTKRPERLKQLAPELSLTPNIWLGTTVENADVMHRIDSIRNLPAQVKFLSLEPLIGPLPNLDLTNIDWVIVGGEKGPSTKIRRMEKWWAYDIKAKCDELNIPFFFKQLGGSKKVENDLLLNGVKYHNFPAN